MTSGQRLVGMVPTYGLSDGPDGADVDSLDALQ